MGNLTAYICGEEEPKGKKKPANEVTNEASKGNVVLAAGGAVRAPLNPGAARARTGIAEALNLGAARGKIENRAFLRA